MGVVVDFTCTNMTAKLVAISWILEVDFRFQKLKEYLGKFKAKYDHILAFEPTGWTHKKAITDLRQLKPKRKQDNIVIYGKIISN